jgi:hypothetical protein
MRICTCCNLELSDDNYYRKKNGALYAVCKRCKHLKFKKYYRSYRSKTTTGTVKTVRSTAKIDEQNRLASKRHWLSKHLTKAEMKYVKSRDIVDIKNTDIIKFLIKTFKTLDKQILTDKINNMTPDEAIDILKQLDINVSYEVESSCIDEEL